MVGRSSCGGTDWGRFTGSGRAAASSGAAAADDETGTGCDGAGAGPARRVAPHMPQKRFWSEFSLPQRVQRTHDLLHL